MSDSIDREEVQAARIAHSRAEQTAHAATVATAVADPATRKAALAALAIASAEERAAREPLRVALGKIIFHTANWSGLDGAVPILMFPIRIETRFVSDAIGRDWLLVRVYPDEILVDTLERGLTPDELAAARTFWTAVWPNINSGGGGADPAPLIRAAWSVLARDRSPERAGYIISAQFPRNTMAATPGPTPDFPEAAPSAGFLARPGIARLLPDNFVVRGYKNGTRVIDAIGQPIPDPLPVTISPRAASITRDAPNDPDIRWIDDFDAAEMVGMGIRVLLTPATKTGVDRLVVAGLKVSMPAISTTGGPNVLDELRALFEAHRFGPGVDLLDRFTPTNNTAGDPSPYPFPPMNDSFAIMLGSRGLLRFEKDTFRGRFMEALGVPGTRDAATQPHSVGFLTTRGGSKSEAPRASAMNRVMWPLGIGSALEEYWSQDQAKEYPDDGSPPQPRTRMLSDMDVDELRKFFVERVHSAGAYPAFRVGVAPYAIIPTTTLATFKRPGLLGGLGRVLRELRPAWVRRLADVPRVELPQNASVPRPSADVILNQILRQQPRGNDLGMAMPGILRSVSNSALDDAFAQKLVVKFSARFPAAGSKAPPALLQRWGRELLKPREVTHCFIPFMEQVRTFPDVDTLPADFLAGLMDVPIFQAPGTSGPSVSTFIPTTGLDIEAVRKLTLSRAIVQMALVEEGRHALRILLDTPGGGAPTADAKAKALELFTKARPSFLSDLWRAYDTVFALPVPELEHRLYESLELMWSRFDAWHAGLAAAVMPAGARNVGCYGWVENLVPRSGPASAGFMIAPSMDHAATAGLLLDGAVTRGGTGNEFQTDLSSTRVRSALELLDAIRAGDHASSYIGRLYERRLSEALAFDATSVLRKKFPAPPGTTFGGPDATLDGIALHNAVLAGLPALGLTPAALKALATADREVAIALDAAGDLGIAESLFQIVKGNHATAGDFIDRLQSDKPIAEPSIVDTPRPGATVAQRVMVRVDGAHAEGWPSVVSERGSVSASVDAWAGQVLGDPHVAMWTLTSSDGSSRTFALASLGVRPLDWIALVADTPIALWLEPRRDTQLADTAVGRMLLRAAASFSIASATPALVRCIAKARMLSNLFSTSRSLRSGDLAEVSAQNIGDAGSTAPVAELDAAVATLADTRRALETIDRNALVAALDRACHYTWNAAIRGDEPDDVLASLAKQVASTLDDRLARIGAMTRPSDSPSRWVGELTMALFGTRVPVAFAVAPSAPESVGAALADDERVVPSKRRTVQRWCETVARAREKLDPLRSWFVLGGATLDNHELRVLQLPAGDDAWAAVKRPKRRTGTSSLVIVQPTGAPNVAATWRGLVLDEWDETVPDADHHGGIAFHYDDAGSEAPQAVLLAVHPTGEVNSRWSADTVFAILDETLENAKIRLLPSLSLLFTVDSGDDDQLFGHFFPTMPGRSNVMIRVASALYSKHLQR